MNLSEVITRAAQRYGSQFAVAAGEGQLTYADLLSRSRRLATAMDRLGICPGDRVAVLARNGFRYLEINFACALLGAILVPLNIRLSTQEIAHIIANTQCRLAFCGTSFDVSGPTPTIHWVDALGTRSDCEYERFLKAGDLDVSWPAKSPADIAQIFFTSGTTGLPKGVCLTHGSLVASGLDSLETLDFDSGDAWLHAAPMFHLVDAFAIWGMTMAGGRHVAVPFEPDTFGSLIEKHRITKTSLPPTLLDWIARTKPRERHDLSSLSLVSYGGSPMQDAVYQRCRVALGCRMLQAYGLTEGSGFVCHEVATDNPNPETVINTVGKPTKRVELTLQDNDGQPTPTGDVGEIAIKGERVFKEYWRDPDATKAARRNGWYRSGDLAVMDSLGRFRVVGRKKEMIITGGENVYPAEVANALLSHPAVAEAAVFGLPSERWGEEVCAVVYIAPNLVATPEELTDHCRKVIGSYKAPKMISIWNSPLPKTGAGKIATATIRDAVSEGL